MIIANQIKCKKCLTVIKSRHRHDYQSCPCGEVSIDGGSDYLKRSYRDVPGEELSIFSTDPFFIIRDNFERGNVGKNGDQPLTWVKLKDMSNAWLENIILGGFDLHFEKRGFNPYKLELEYRKNYNIFIEE